MLCVVLCVVLRLRYDTTILQNAGCTYKDTEGVDCCLRAFPDRACLGVEEWELSITAACSLGFFVLYVVGIPLFFIYLVREGVSEVRVPAVHVSSLNFISVRTSLPLGSLRLAHSLPCLLCHRLLRHGWIASFSGGQNV